MSSFLEEKWKRERGLPLENKTKTTQFTHRSTLVMVFFAGAVLGFLVARMFLV